MRFCGAGFRSLLTLAVLLGCHTEGGQKVERGIGMPGATVPAKIHSVVKRGEFLDTLIEGNKVPPRLFFRTADGCENVLVEGHIVEYVMSGRWGRLRSGEVSCDPAGIGDPTWWRSRQSHGSGRMNPTAPTPYTKIYQDQEIALLRGRFPLTARIGWQSYGDTIAVIPNEPPCTNLLDQTIATMEYRAIGDAALLLMTREGNCRIVGLIAPRGRP